MCKTAVEHPRVPFPNASQGKFTLGDFQVGIDGFKSAPVIARKDVWRIPTHSEAGV